MDLLGDLSTVQIGALLWKKKTTLSADLLSDVDSNGLNWRNQKLLCIQGVSFESQIDHDERCFQKSSVH